MRKLIFITLLLLYSSGHSAWYNNSGAGEDGFVKTSGLTTWYKTGKSAFTVMGWVYLDDTTDDCFILPYDYSWAEWVFRLSKTTSKRISTHLAGTNPGGWVEGTAELENDTWYHLAYTYDGSHRRTYINGVMDINQAETGTTTGNAGITLGVLLGSYAKGSNFSVWNYAKSAAEIEEAMMQRLISDERCMGLWYCDEKVINGAPGGVIMRDTSGNGIHLDERNAGSITNDNYRDGPPIQW